MCNRADVHAFVHLSDRHALANPVVTVGTHKRRGHRSLVDTDGDKHNEPVQSISARIINH